MNSTSNGHILVIFLTLIRAACKAPPVRIVSTQCGRSTDLCLDVHCARKTVFRALLQRVPAKINKTRQAIYYPFGSNFIKHR